MPHYKHRCTCFHFTVWGKPGDAPRFWTNPSDDGDDLQSLRTSAHRFQLDSSLLTQVVPSQLELMCLLPHPEGCSEKWPERKQRPQVAVLNTRQLLWPLVLLLSLPSKWGLASLPNHGRTLRRTGHTAPPQEALNDQLLHQIKEAVLSDICLWIQDNSYIYVTDSTSKSPSPLKTVSMTKVKHHPFNN